MAGLLGPGFLWEAVIKRCPQGQAWRCKSASPKWFPVRADGRGCCRGWDYVLRPSQDQQVLCVRACTRACDEENRPLLIKQNVYLSPPTPTPPPNPWSGHWGLCRPEEDMCSRWPCSPSHTRSIPGAPAGWPRIAGIPGEGTSSPSHPVFCLSQCQRFRICFSSVCYTLTSARRGFQGEGLARVSLICPRHSWPWAFLSSSAKWGEWPLIALGGKCHVPLWGRWREEALGLPSALLLEPLHRGRRVSFTTLSGATLPPPKTTDTV